MHIFIICLSAALILFSCRSYSVIVERDDITQKNIYRLDLAHQAVKGDFSVDFAKYERESKGGILSPISVTMLLAGDEKAKDMKKNAIILVDDKLFNVIIGNDPKAETYVRKWATGSINESGNVGATGSYSGSGSISVNVHETSWNMFTPKIILSNEIAGALRQAKKYKMRFYMNHEEWTVEATEPEIRALQKLIDINPGGGAR
jgi:hypothetical protein